MPPKPPHAIEAPEDDADLQKVLAWLRTKKDIRELLTSAVVDAVDYVLDGLHTGRFDLDDPEVDSDERASVGTKVQYRIITTLDLIKEKPLDTHIAGVPVDIKNTIGDSWMIPKEAQCELCLLIHIDNKNDQFSARLMRTHETMPRPGKNQDSKRGIIAERVTPSPSRCSRNCGWNCRATRCATSRRRNGLWCSIRRTASPSAQSICSRSCQAGSSRAVPS